MNNQTCQQTSIISFPVTTFQMEFLGSEMCPDTAQLRFNEQTVSCIEHVLKAINDLPIEALYLDHSAIDFELTYFNVNGEEVNVEEQMELKLKLSKSSNLQIVLSANDTEITDDEGEAFTCTGEFFGEVLLGDMKTRIAEIV
jgi:hypothetical protein